MSGLSRDARCDSRRHRSASLLGSVGLALAIAGHPASLRAVDAPASTGGELLEEALPEDLSLDLEQQLAPDPWEPFNRGVFAFNQGFDRLVADPVFRVYRFVVPEAPRRALFRAFRNLRSPAVFTNQLLQLRFADAGRTLGRFILNSTLGLAGLVDAAEGGVGWRHEPADFGQTLGRYGIPTGPYLIVPILGPSTLRDLVGTGADFMLDPLMYVFGPSWWIPAGVGEGFTRIEAAHGELQRLESDSVEYYSALRSVYYQYRVAAVARARERSGFTSGRPDPRPEMSEERP